MDDAQLKKLSVAELRELQNRIHMAIRAQIRRKQEAMQHRAGPKTETREAAPSVDLATERDAWLARRR